MKRASVNSAVLILLAVPNFGLAATAPSLSQTGAILASAPPVQLSIKLTPVPAISGGPIQAVGVELNFGAIQIPPGTPLLRLALLADNVDTVATTLTELKARDAKGPLNLTVHDVDLAIEGARDSQAGGPSREWLADRTPQGSVTISYTVPGAATLPPRGPTGPLAFRNDAGGVSAAGNIFLLMPPGRQRYNVTTSWNLDRLQAGALGVTSLGEGVASSAAPMTSAEVRQSYFQGGAIHRWPVGGTDGGFFSSWQGTPPFNAEALMQWTDKLHQNYAKFFGQPPQPYGVFLRYNPVNAGGGTGFFHSFVATFGAGRGSNPEFFKTLMAHEMFHTFSPYITDPPGNSSSWFGEGLAVFYQARLPLRYGLITPQAFVDDLNFAAARYYSSLTATLPNSAIAARFWKDTRVRTLTYDRGMLYFVTVDYEMRQKYHNERSLDTLMLRMLALSNTGVRLANSDWESGLRANLGEGAVVDFRDFMNGKMPVPTADAFGPCFTRTTAIVRRYEIGFDPAVLSETRRIIRNLVPGSAADKAGLRNGDEIIKPVPQDEIQGNQTELLSLAVRRADNELTITYLPRGEPVEVYQWKRLPNVPADQCGV